jgi:uncharacterized lipoprotein YddW (UPF0748 family)
MHDEFELGMWAYMDFRERPLGDEDLKRFVEWSERVGIQKVLMCIRSDLFALYPNSKMLPTAPKFRNWNALGEVIKEFHDLGKEVHAMIVVAPWLRLGWRPGGSDDLKPRPALLDNLDWLPTDRYGVREDKAPFFGSQIDLDVGKPEVRQYVADHVEDVLKANPELDGIHLDFIRFRYWKSTMTINTRDGADFGRLINKGDIVYVTKEVTGLTGQTAVKLAYYLSDTDRTKYAPYDGTRAVLEREYAYCFCDSCLRRFEDETGTEVPRELRNTKDKADWILTSESSKWFAWRAAQVTDQVRLIKDRMRKLSSKYKLSAATFARFPPHGIMINDVPPEKGDYDSVVKCLGQDWISWANDGLLDFAEPMLYWTDPRDFGTITGHLMDRIRDKNFPIYPGVLVSNDYVVEPTQVVDYAKAALKARGSGITLFPYAGWSSSHRKAWGLPEIRDYDDALVSLKALR